MATSRKSDLQRQLRELDEQRARLMAELRASEQESAPPPSDEDDLVNEGIKFPDGTRDGDDDGKERSKSQCTAERTTTPRPPSPRPLTTEPPRDLVAAPRPVATQVVRQRAPSPPPSISAQVPDHHKHWPVIRAWQC